jgi:hypothetical protein
MNVHTPDSTPANDRLVVFCSDATPAFRFYTSTWVATTATISPADTFAYTGSLSFASLHGKLFIASNSDAARLHVYDGTVIRRTGMATPAPPTAADTGGGTLIGSRYYRQRYVAMSGSTVLRRSEPSVPTALFTPSGAGSAVRVTKSATVAEGETHWELEESVDGGATYYRIATTAVGTTTYDDSLATTAVATTGTLSADTGDYTYSTAARFLVVDRDRLLMFGDHDDATKDSDMTWSVVGSDTTGVGNDERIPTDTGNRLSIDGQSGGRLTGAAAFDTQVIAFKKKAVYMISHTRNRIGAYTFDPLSTTFGAVEGSICNGVDEHARPALYFLDSTLGPMRYGARGFEQLAPQQQSTFQGYFNAAATAQAANTVFLPKRREIHFHIAQVNGSQYTDWPTLAMVYNIETGGISWTFRSGDATYLNGYAAFSSVLWNDVAYITTVNGAGGGSIVQLDVTGTTQDFGFRSYISYFRTKAFAVDPLGLQRRFKVMGGVLGARPLSGVSVSVSIVRDYGKEVATVSALLTPNAATNPSGVDERFVTIPLDDCVLSEGTVMQFQFGDTAVANTLPWSIEQFTATVALDGVNVEGK